MAMKGSMRLGRAFGIGLFVHWTFLILIGWVVFWQMRGGAELHEILIMVFFTLLLFLCVTLHELGHALMARRFGIGTQDITLLPIGGLARLDRMPEDPKQELAVAFAGPAVNVVIAAVLFLVLLPTGGLETEVQDLSQIGESGKVFLNMLFGVNVMLVIFNLIPAFPMDGGRVLRALLAFKLARPVATKVAARIGQGFSVLFIIAGLLPGVSPFLILIGVFVFVGAQAETNYVSNQSMLTGFRIRDVIIDKYFTIETNQSIQDAIKILLDTQAKDFLVMEQGTVAGTLGRNEIIRALADKGPGASVSEVMNADFVPVHPDLPLTDFFQLMQQSKEMFLPVMENNVLIGVVDSDNILEFLMIKDAMAGK